MATARCALSTRAPPVSEGRNIATASSPAPVAAARSGRFQAGCKLTLQTTKGLGHQRNLKATCKNAVVAAATAVDAPEATDASKAKKNLKVLVAGGGIGGLTLARSLQKKGMDVQVFEKVKEYKPFGGPIQLQCNAIGTIEAIDMDLANQIYDNCSVTGDRINGLMDGLTGEWFFRFDTRQPCYRNGLPLTLVINRFKLLELLVDCVGRDNVQVGAEIVSYTEDADGVTATLSDGSTVHGDVLVGADGIRSKVRQAMHVGEKSPLAYSGYTVYTATCDFTGTLTDTSKIGYQVYLGPDKYFVASDVGDGRQQWYAFHLTEEGGSDSKCPKETLQDFFEDWTPAMKERIECTKPEDIERRDVFDVIPSISPFTWSKGRVVLLGDAVHAVQPNLGQGGGQAIESAYTLAAELEQMLEQSPNPTSMDVRLTLKRYSFNRILRAGNVHGLSRMLGLLNIVYRSYLGTNPYKWYPEPVRKFFLKVSELKIPHPGRVMGQIIMMNSMQYILEYIGSAFSLPQVIGGAPITVANLKGERVLACPLPGVGSPKRPLTDEDFKMKGFPGLGK